MSAGIFETTTEQLVEDADLDLFLSVPESARQNVLTLIERSLTSHEAPDAGRFIAARRALPEELRRHWRSILLSMAATAPEVSVTPVAK